MRLLPASLLAAQRSSSAQPYLRVRLFDQDAGSMRLRWTRWYSGSEPDGPCGAAAPGDGALLRARIVPADGSLMYQRVASPTTGASYNAWSSLGTVAVVPGVGLAAAGTRTLIATVRTDSSTVEVRESSTSGTVFGASSVVATATSVTAVTSVLQADGSAAVFYAAGGTVYRVTRSGLGAWAAPVAWTQSLASVSGLAASFDGDYDVLVSGTRASGEAGVWSTVYGLGQFVAPGSWLALSEVAAAAAGTSVTYRATGTMTVDVPRAVFVESYGGGGAYDRAHLASGVAQRAYRDGRWRDPRPFERSSPYGLAMATDGSAHAWLCSPAGVWHAPWALEVTELTGDVLEADVQQGFEGGRARVALRNDDGRYNAGASIPALAAGGELHIEPGYETSAGAQSSEAETFWITSVRRRRGAGSATVELEAVDGWGLLDAWAAARQFVWAAGTKSIAQLLEALLQRPGLAFAGLDGSVEAQTAQPAFTVHPGERGTTAVRRLLAALPDLLLMRGTEAVLLQADASSTADYVYGIEHVVLRLDVSEGRPGAGWARVFGGGVFAQAVDESALEAGAGAALAVDDNLTLGGAEARAAALLRRSALVVPRGSLVVPVNCGQEAGDVIAVTDSSLGLASARFRVDGVRLRFARETRRPFYEMTLSLISV